MSRAAITGLLLAVAGCGGGAVEPCQGGQPGVHIIAHFPDLTFQDWAQLVAIDYANQTTQEFNYTMATGSGPRTVDLRLAYGPTAVDGPAMLFVYADGHHCLATSFDVDLTRCAVVEGDATGCGTDAGVAATAP